MNPKVTVLMAVHNGEKYLQEAVESILNQTFLDFEFLIINDGSTDKTEEILLSYKDPRIRLIKNDSNIGLTRSLNKGLDLAKGEYIARMDADDVSLPNRLELQVEFLEKNTEIGLVGSWAKIIGKKTKKYIKGYSDPEKIRAQLLFKNAVVHPSVMIRKNLFQKYNLRYDENLKYSQDFELWTRCVSYFPISNIKKVLILYRVHQGSVSKINSRIQKRNSCTTRIKYLKSLNIDINEEETSIHCSSYKPDQYKITDFLQKKEKWLLKLQNQNTKIRQKELNSILGWHWLYVCSINSVNSFTVFKRFWRSEIRKFLDLTKFQNIKMILVFFLKCLRFRA